MSELLEKINPGFNLIVGKPMSGKSFLLKYLLMTDHPDYNKAPIKYGIVFTTTKFNRFWESHFPSEYIHQKYDPAALTALLEIQADTGAAHRAVVIFDDCLDQKAFASQLFTNLTTTYRHYNIDLYLVTQYLYKVPPTVRECASRVAIFRTTTERSLSACFESFGAFFNNFNEFKRFIVANTGDYQFVWYIANSSAEQVDQIYKVLKCPESVPDFRFIF
jgi:hypothetical protein